MAQQENRRPPIIDVHLHALGVEALRSFGPNQITGEAPPESVGENVRRRLAEMREYNVVIGIVGGRNLCPDKCAEEVARFLAAAPERVWGSVWPEAIGLAIDAIESAEFLTAQQKRDIFYNNAARFLRLSPEEVARHHAR